MKTIRKIIAMSCVMMLFISVFGNIRISEAKISMNKTKIILNVGQKAQLKLKGKVKADSWKSAKNDVATVSKKGVVVAKSVGKTTIIAKSGKQSCKCKVTVKPIPSDYTIVKVDGTPDWSTVPEFMIDQVLWMPDAGIRAKGQICHDNENIFVRLQATEKNIRAENTELFSPVYEDSCLEFFFMRDGAEGYFNFETNPNGVLNIQYGPSKPDRTFLVRENHEEYFDIHTARTEDGWEVSYRIPIGFISMIYPGFSFSDVLKVNAYKCGNKTVQRHYLAWKPVDTEIPNFHVPESFGTMTFQS